MAYATFVEMAKLRPGGIDLADVPRAEALLEEATDLINEEVGPLKAAEWSAVDAVVPTAARSVCIQVALRVFDNPGGISMEQATGYMYQRPQAFVTGLELTKAERARVRRAAGLSTAYSIRTPSGVDEDTIASVFATAEITELEAD